ncbi:hypothetical protein LUZ60_001411 [Juncus effusus]|nr:hypothetical protein LUZ60_001411 [Juncus effusus]
MILFTSSASTIDANQDRSIQCWRVLDLSDWDSVTARIVVPVTFNNVINHVLRFVREYELIEEVYFPPDANEQDLFLVYERLPKLVYLSFPKSKIPKLAFYSALTNFTSLKGIAVSYRFFLTIKVISLCAQYPAVSELKLLGDSPWGNYATKMICYVFPELRKLDMREQHFVISDDTVLRLLDSLKQLEYLDISGCTSLTLDERVIEKAASRLKVFILHGMNS